MIRRRLSFLLVLAMMAPLVCSGQTQNAQSADWETAAGGRQSFEVASVKLAAPGYFHPPSFPISEDDSFVATGGRFTAVFPLTTYIQFAWKIRLTQEQWRVVLAPLPKWVATDRFEIEARTKASSTANPTKDQMRLMVRDVLETRFHLAARVESRPGKIFALELVKPGGTPGPKLVKHTVADSCDAAATSNAAPSAGRQPLCGAYEMEIDRSGLRHVASRLTTLPLIARQLPGLGDLDRPVEDRTALSGAFDFTLDYVPETGGAVPTDQNGNPIGPALIDALRDQLGLKLVGAEGIVRTLAIDHVERPSEN